MMLVTLLVFVVSLATHALTFNDAELPNIHWQMRKDRADFTNSVTNSLNLPANYKTPEYYSYGYRLYPSYYDYYGKDYGNEDDHEKHMRDNKPEYEYGWYYY